MPCQEILVDSLYSSDDFVGSSLPSDELSCVWLIINFQSLLGEISSHMNGYWFIFLFFFFFSLGIFTELFKNTPTFHFNHNSLLVFYTDILKKNGKEKINIFIIYWLALTNSAPMHSHS